jgi:type II secretory pathway pseudopilin PulG
MNTAKLLINLVLILIIGLLVYKLVATIQEPITFQKEKAKRDAVAIERLKQIRLSQLAFKGKYGHYSGSFDSLINMVKTDSFEVVKVIGDPNDSTVVVKKEVFKKSMLDSLFAGNAQDLAQIPEVPFSKKGDKFNIQAALITKNNTEIPAFEVSAPLKVIYSDLPNQYYADKFNDVMRVGNINDGTTTGSWDK